MDEKRELRQTTLVLRASLSDLERKSKSNLIQQSLVDLPEYQIAKTVMTFLDFKDEVQTTELAERILNEGKKLIIPLCGPNRKLIPAVIRDMKMDLAPGMWGIREPKKESLVKVNEEEIDLVIVPGVAFDLQGGRLGYGGGYYDRFLPMLRPEVKRVGLAFECQIVDNVPREEHDLPLDILITEAGTIRF